ncbi:MAG: 4-alpha-glucanotransferase [Clostridia bacterium]|nr:4-alpha-glucanotransferase [Clostridia bacterium]
MAKAANKFKRAAGILLPISSLPSNYGIGTLGAAAYNFIDFLKASGQSYWQILPVGATSYGDSPYQSFSAFAGNPYYIDLDMLKEEGLISQKDINSYKWGSDPHKVDYPTMFYNRFKLLKTAFEAWDRNDEAYALFCDENADWLDDYSMYMAIKFHNGQRSWLEWDDDIRTRQPEALEKYRGLLKEDILFWSFLQYKFFAQWEKLREYAHANSVEIIGDIPIYVAMDSADTWANGRQFMLDEDMRPLKVAGVPPDCFSADGQLWGNPLYRWDVMEADGFGWWKRRISFSSKIYDVIRIDHFIGITRYYSIDAGSETAKVGEWLDGPGMKLIAAIDEARGRTKIIAEDLGLVVPAVRAVQKKAGYPGMKVLQFAFGDDATNHFLPHNHTENFIVYTGTHDNDTTAGYIQTMRRRELAFTKSYLGVKRRRDITAALVRAAYMSVAHTAIIPIQDILELGSQARINTPSTVGGNWEWRLDGAVLTEKLSKQLLALAQTYGRVQKSE